MFTSARRVAAALNARLEAAWLQSRRKRRGSVRARQSIAAIESLEDRRLLSVITVTSLADVVQDGDEQLTLREAILVANDSTGATSFEGVSSTDVADRIVFDGAVFSASVGDFNTDTIFLGSQLPVVTEVLTIDGSIDSGTARVIIDGGHESRILENASDGLNLGKLVLQNGFAFGNGGAVLNDSEAVLSLNAVEISDSRALRISSLANSSDAGGSGGGLYNAAGGTLKMTNSVVMRNSAAENGGGVHNEGRLWISIDAASGLYRVIDGTLEIRNSTIAENSAGSDGGGIANGGSFTITRSTIAGNTSEGNGGGIASWKNLTVQDSTISENVGLFGGGIYNERLTDADEIWDGSGFVTNSTVSGNRAVASGGGMHSLRGMLSLTSATFAFNSADESGGGISTSSGRVGLRSTIVAENTSSLNPDFHAAVIDSGWNLIGDTTGVTFVFPHHWRTLLNFDPRLGPLQDNGGPTATHALLHGSPAIDTGEMFTRDDFDQRGPGFRRSVGPQMDIGAFEVQGITRKPGLIVVGSGLGTSPEIRFGGTVPAASFEAFPEFVRGGVRVATGDVNGDGVADIVASSSSKGQPRVRVFDGTDLTGGTLLMDFFAYVPEFGGGVFVATGDFNNDGRADIVTGAGAGGGPHVKVFSGADLSGNTLLMSFFAYDPNFGGGVEVAAGDVNGDGIDDVITGAGPGGGPHVRVFSGADLSTRTELMSFYAYVPEFGGGVHVAAGDLNNDGRDDVITGAGFGGGPHVKAFSGADLSSKTLLENFFAYDSAFLGGVRVASGDVNGDGVDDLVTGAGPSGGPHVRAFDGRTGAELASFYGASSSFGGGLHVAVAEELSVPRSDTNIPRGSSGTNVGFETVGFSLTAKVYTGEPLDAFFAEMDLAPDLSTL